MKCVRYRNNPILTCALMADYPACEQSLLFSIVRSARIWADLEKLGIPGIRGVFSFPEAAGGFGATAVSIEQRYPGHAAQVAALAAQVPGRRLLRANTLSWWMRTWIPPTSIKSCGP